MAKITAVVNDLIFMTRIRDAADHFGLTVAFVADENQASLKDSDVFIIDLENDFIDPVELISHVKKDHAASKILGYFSHVNTQVKTQALSAGCDEVFTRSEFNSNLKEILQSYCF